MDLAENSNVPIAQISDIRMASSTYANSYSFTLMQKQLQHYEDEQLDTRQTMVDTPTYYGAGSLKDRLDPTALFFDDLYTILHEKNYN